MSDGYCKHGTYVGGIGVDWMCHKCEMGADYLILDAPIADIRLVKNMDSWMRFRSFESIKDTVLDLWEEYPDLFTINTYTERVWVTEEEAYEALEEGLRVASPYRDDDFEELPSR